MAKLINKKIIQYKGNVHDLTIENSHSYNVEGISVHNSVSGSLLAYVLNISQVDPIRWGTLWHRFLTRYKTCLDRDTFIITESGIKQMKDLKEGEKVLTRSQSYFPIIFKEESIHEEVLEFELEDGTRITCSLNHKWIVNRDGKEIEIKAKDILETDEFKEKM